MILRLDNKPREHDYTKPMWGFALHDVQLQHVRVRPTLWRWICGDRSRAETRLTALAHGSLMEGDTILVAMKSGRVARFRIDLLRSFRDPDDMYDIKRAIFLNYKDETT